MSAYHPVAATFPATQPVPLSMLSSWHSVVSDESSEGPASAPSPEAHPAPATAVPFAPAVPKPATFLSASLQDPEQAAAGAQAAPPAKRKPGRKPKNDMEGVSKRIYQNRLAQQAHRERKAHHLKSLQDQVENLTALLGQSRAEVAGLVLYVDQLRDESKSLRELTCVNACTRRVAGGFEMCMNCRETSSAPM
ncbi:hypothetical protein BC830DRAFT_1164175 [Chytriomyces sp. MP71]|nr:hypothetical protein BC830DRAFT_1164175 [Chytriomyces sp. MP71]